MGDGVKNISDLEDRIIKIADKCLKRKYRKTNVGIKQEEEPIWFTEEIRSFGQKSKRGEELIGGGRMTHVIWKRLDGKSYI